MIRRLIKWFLILTIVIVGIVGFVLPLAANTDEGRSKVAEIVGDSVHRKVKIGGLKIGWFFTSVSIQDLDIANPEGFPEGSLVRAKSIDIDSSFKEILNKKVIGSVDGSELVVHIIKKGGKTNLDGMADANEEPDQDGSGGPDMDLSLDLANSKLIIEDLDKNEKIELEGVGLTMQFTNRKGQAATGLKLTVRSIERDTITVRDLNIDAAQVGDYLDLKSISALLPGDGKLNGSGKMRIRGGNDWNVKLKAKDVAIEKNMVPLVAGMFPMVASASDAINGNINADFTVKGNGLTWVAMRPTLDGTGAVSLNQLQLPAGSLLAQVASLAGRGDGAIDLNSAGANFNVQNGWVNFKRLSASGDKARYDFAGRVSLEGGLDLSMDLMPLVKTFGGGKLYSKIGNTIKELPVRIRGTTASPQIKAPKAEDLLKGAATGLLEKGLGKALDKFK